MNTFTDKETEIIKLTLHNMGLKILSETPDYIKNATLEIHNKWYADFFNKGILCSSLKSGLIEALKWRIQKMNDLDDVKKSIQCILEKIDQL